MKLTCSNGHEFNVRGGYYWGRITHRRARKCPVCGKPGYPDESGKREMQSRNQARNRPAFTILLTLALLLGGCMTRIQYNPVTHDILYESPAWGKEFDSLSIKMLEDGSVEVTVNKYKHEGIGPIVEGAVRGAIQGVKP